MLVFGVVVYFDDFGLSAITILKPVWEIFRRKKNILSPNSELARHEALRYCHGALFSKTISMFLLWL